MRWAVFFGAALMMVSGGSLIAVEQTLAHVDGSVRKADLFGDGKAAAPQRLEGPLNILLAGIDPREPQEVPRADSVIIVHVPRGLDRAYVFSLPRDLVVSIPAFAKAGFGGAESEKLAHAMYFGADASPPRPAYGFELLAQTVANHTGITRFDAGAIIDFGGFQRVIDELGGIDLVVDQEVRSLHLRPDGAEREPAVVGYTGPQMVYPPGRHHLVGWQALDFARQRYIEGGDYARQRHQQQLIRSMIDKAFSAEVVTNPGRMDRVLRAAGASLIFSGRGVPLAEWALALRDLRPGNLTLVHLSGGGVMADDGQYLGETLDVAAFGFFDSLLDGSVDSYVVQHPEMVG